MLREQLRIDATVVRSRIDALKGSFPELVDDMELLAGMIEGETDFERVMDRLANAYEDAKSLQDAAMLRSRELQDRAKSFEGQAGGYRALIFDLMRAAEQTSVRLPTATLSVRKGLQRVVVDDEARLPQGMVRIERKPILSAIGEALEAGDDLDGIAHLETGPEGLTIRVK